MAKSPVSLLNEFAMKNNLDIPVYTFTANNNQFTCTVVCGNLSVVSESFSKKSAKIKAANDMYNQLFKMTEKPMTTYKSVSSISILKEYCEKNKLAAPTYQFVGIGKSKQLAKEQAANIMLAQVQGDLLKQNTTKEGAEMQHKIDNLKDIGKLTQSADTSTLIQIQRESKDNTAITETIKNSGEIKEEICTDIEDDTTNLQLKIDELEENLKKSGKEYNISIISEKSPCVLSFSFKLENQKDKPFFEIGFDHLQTKYKLLNKVLETTNAI